MHACKMDPKFHIVRTIRKSIAWKRRSLLADKLLAKTDYDCDREIHTLELLKLRFGDANLHNCEARSFQCTPVSSWLSAHHPPEGVP